MRQNYAPAKQSEGFRILAGQCLSHEWQQRLEYQTHDQGKNHFSLIFKGHNAIDNFSEFSKHIANQVMDCLKKNNDSGIPLLMIGGISNGPLHRHLWQVQHNTATTDPLHRILESSSVVLEENLLSNAEDIRYLASGSVNTVQLKAPDGQSYGAIVIPTDTFFNAENERLMGNNASKPTVENVSGSEGEYDITPPDQQIWSKSSEVIRDMWEKLDRHTTNPLQVAVGEDTNSSPELVKKNGKDTPVVDANKSETTTRRFVQELLDTLNESEQPVVELVTPPQRTKQFQKKEITSDPLRPRRIETAPRAPYPEDNEGGLGIILIAIILGILALGILWYFNSAPPSLGQNNQPATSSQTATPQQNSTP